MAYVTVTETFSANGRESRMLKEMPCSWLAPLRATAQAGNRAMIALWWPQDMANMRSHETALHG